MRAFSQLAEVPGLRIEVLSEGAGYHSRRVSSFSLRCVPFPHLPPAVWIRSQTGAEFTQRLIIYCIPALSPGFRTSPLLCKFEEGGEGLDFDASYARQLISSLLWILSLPYMLLASSERLSLLCVRMGQLDGRGGSDGGEFALPLGRRWGRRPIVLLSLLFTLADSKFLEPPRYFRILNPTRNPCSRSCVYPERGGMAASRGKN